MNTERPEPPPRLLERLRQLVGYTWDGSKQPFHSSYDIWHIFGTKHLRKPTKSSDPTTPLSGNTSSLGHDPNSRRHRLDREDSKDQTHFEDVDVEVVARISVHALQQERAYHICKSLISTVDPNGNYVVRPLDIIRLAGQNGSEGPVVVCIFEYAGPDYLSQVLDHGPAWYRLRMDEDSLHNNNDVNFTVEPISLETFLQFAIGAAECIEILHGQKIVHGEIRGDAFHMNEESRKVKLINLGAGLRTFEHGLTSSGWSAMAKELGVKTKLSYMSPEQTGRMGIEPDSRTDIFSLGILFWTILLQKPAFKGESPMDIIQAVLGQRLPSVSNTRLDIPEVIGRIIQKATAKSVWDRYHSVSGLRYDLVEVQRLLATGDSAQLLNWEIATKDVSPFFILPKAMVGRNAEHGTIVEVIDRAFNSSQASLRRDKYSVNNLSRLYEGQVAGFDLAFTGADPSFEDDNGSSADGRSNSLSMSDAASADSRVYKPNTGKLRSPADTQHTLEDTPQDIDSKSPQKRPSITHESVTFSDSVVGVDGWPISTTDSTGSMIKRGNSGSIRKKRRCEVITIAGGMGLGKSRLIQSVQVEARQRGYFASSKFHQAEKTPFGPVLKLISSLFQQVFSESNVDTSFHQILKRQAAPTWPILHKVLRLPEHLLGSTLPVRTKSLSDKLSRGYSRSLKAGIGRREASPIKPRSRVLNKAPATPSPQDFLLAGSSTKSLPLMATLLDILRTFSQHKFICFCFDDLHFADDESVELITQIIATRIKMVIIVSYRIDHSISNTMRAIIEPSDFEDDRKTRDLGVTRITLKPLGEDDIMVYVATAIRRPKSDIFPLGIVVQSKTGGNPFYIRDMLDACHRKKLIWYDYRERGWLFNVDGIFNQFSAEDYDTFRDDFVASRLSELPDASRSILAWASMVGGTSFSFQLIQRLLNGEFVPDKKDYKSEHSSTPTLFYHSEQDLVRGLQAALQAYIILPTQNDDVFRFAQDRYIQAAASIWEDDGSLKHFIMAQTLLKYYSHDNKYQNILSTSIHESISMIKELVAHRRPFRKVLSHHAQAACESGVRSAAIKSYTSCIALLQDDMWNDDAEDVYYDETLLTYTAAAECYLFRGQYEDAMRLLISISSNAKTAVDKAPSWILQSRVFTQEGDSTSAFQALKECLAALEVKVDDDPTFPKCDSDFKLLCQEIQSIDIDNLAKKPMVDNVNLAAVGAVLVEASSAAFWSDTLTFYQMTLIMVSTYLSSGSFPQAGMGFLQLALIAVTRHNMISFASDCGNLALELIERWRDPYTMGRGGTVYSTFVGHLQQPLQESVSQLEGALEFAIQAGDRTSTILNLGLVGNLKFFASEDLTELELSSTELCRDIPDWQSDTPGGTMIITIRQLCRALQGKTNIRDPQGVMSDEQHSSVGYKSWVMNAVKNSDRPLMLYESIEIAPLFLYGHYSSAVALGNTCLKKINALWSARNTRFLMFFHALSLAGSIWIKVQEQLDPVYRRESPQLSSDINGRSLEAGLIEEMAGMAMLIKYFKRRIEQWQAVTDVNYLAWSKLLAAQVAEMEADHTSTLRFYEEAIDHASAHSFVFEEALANKLLGEYLLRFGSRRLAKTAFREAISLYRQISATGVARHIEEEQHLVLRESRYNRRTTEVGIQTDPEEDLRSMQHHIDGFGHDDSRFSGPSIETNGDRIAMWQGGTSFVGAGAGPTLHMLDLASILESSQVISSVLQVDQLLKTMCEIILQNCKGVASLAAIIIEEDPSIGWAVAASSDPENGAEAHNPPLPLRESAAIAENVVNYCTRFRETVFLPDLMQDQRFSNVSDTWVTRNPMSKSVVALPICHGSDSKALLGVVYLEGYPAAFTNRNLEVLQLLVNQIGISYSNALRLKEVERVSAINKSMVDIQKKALAKAIAAENSANIAKAEALQNAKLAEEAAKAKTTFLANISHELRTPLNGVIGNSELLLESHSEKQQAEMADAIRVSADLLLSLINDILDFSKIEAHKMDLHLTAFNANEMVREIIRSIPATSRNKNTLKNVRILQDIHLPQALIYGDPVRLHQILGNLVSNSLKFTEKGSVTVGAKTEWETNAAVHLTFWIKDTGIGISPRQIHKLFKPFSQADASTARKYGGSGLGLSICKSLVESMGGTINLESEENVGTTVFFSLTLPKAKPEAVVGDDPNESGRHKARSPEEQARAGYIDFSEVPNTKPRICVAEDNPINQKLVLQFLERLGFKEVDAYDNGLEAVEGIRKKAKEGRPYHLVLMDVQMPVLDGYDATKLLRKDSMDTVRGILIIALTASAVEGDREKCLSSGMNDYLAKPVRLAVLKKMLGHYI